MSRARLSRALRTARRARRHRLVSRGMVSRAARYRTRHGIPRGTVSHAARKGESAAHAADELRVAARHVPRAAERREKVGRERLRTECSRACAQAHAPRTRRNPPGPSGKCVNREPRLSGSRVGSAHLARGTDSARRASGWRRSAKRVCSACLKSSASIVWYLRSLHAACGAAQSPASPYQPHCTARHGRMRHRPPRQRCRCRRPTQPTAPAAPAGEPPAAVLSAQSIRCHAAAQHSARHALDAVKPRSARHRRVVEEVLRPAWVPHAGCSAAPACCNAGRRLATKAAAARCHCVATAFTVRRHDELLSKVRAAPLQAAIQHLE
jgi:hypothetical protein